VLID
jgi:DnaJ-class molecular chaperone